MPGSDSPGTGIDWGGRRAFFGFLACVSSGSAYILIIQGIDTSNHRSPVYTGGAGAGVEVVVSRREGGRRVHGEF